MENGIYAHFNTSKGKIIVQLTFEKPLAPSGIL